MSCSLRAIVIKHIYEQAQKPCRTPRPQRYILIARSTPNQSTPILLHPLTNTQRHRLMCLHCQSIHYCLPDSHRHQRHQKNCTSISDTSPPPFSSCGGHTNLLSRPYACDSTLDNIAALERSNSNQKKVRYHVFMFLNAA